MRSLDSIRSLGVVCGLIATLAVGEGWAIETVPLIKDFTGWTIDSGVPVMPEDPPRPPLEFGVGQVFNGTLHLADINHVLNGNAVLAINQFGGILNVGDGAGFSLPVLSNGENGIDRTIDMGLISPAINDDIPNTVPVSAAVDLANGGDGTQGNKLANGNVLRFSAWFRSDPNLPITEAPQIEPVMKFEIWKEALSRNQDTDNGNIAPARQDEMFDQQQHGINIPLPVAEKNHWIDIDQDGSLFLDNPGNPIPANGGAAAEGRATQISSNAWTRVEMTYTIDDSFWFGIGDNVPEGGCGGCIPPNPDTSVVDAVEEVRITLFTGDFTSPARALNQDGRLLIDNILVEIFEDQAALEATPLVNPDPILDEVGDLVGDYNENGVVDAADYAIWRDTLGSTTDLRANGDDTGASAGVVDRADYDAWVANFGATAGAGSGLLSSSVPEPTSWALTLLVATGALAAVRRSMEWRQSDCRHM